MQGKGRHRKKEKMNLEEAPLIKKELDFERRI